MDSPLDWVVTGETGVREGVQKEHWLFAVREQRAASLFKLFTSFSTMRVHVCVWKHGQPKICGTVCDELEEFRSCFQERFQKAINNYYRQCGPPSWCKFTLSRNSPRAAVCFGNKY